MRDRELEVKLSLDDRKLRTNLKRSLNRSESDTATATEKMASSWNKARVAALGVVAGVTAVTVAIKKLVDAYAIQEQAELRLDAAIESTGGAVDRLGAKYKRFAATLQSETARGDEEIMGAMETLLRFGNVSEDQMERAIRGTLDWARALDKDLNAAALDISKALTGNVMMLQRYGVQIDKATVETDGAAAIFDALEEKVAGTEKAFANTVQGSGKQMSNLLGDIAEKAGQAVVELGTLAAGFDSAQQAAKPTIRALENINTIMAFFNDNAGGAANALAGLRDGFMVVSSAARGIAQDLQMTFGALEAMGLVAKSKSDGTSLGESRAEAMARLRTQYNINDATSEEATFDEQVKQHRLEILAIREKEYELQAKQRKEDEAALAAMAAMRADGYTLGRGGLNSDMSVSPSDAVGSIMPGGYNAGSDPLNNMFSDEQTERVQANSAVMVDAASMVGQAFQSSASQTVAAVYDMIAAHELSAAAIPKLMFEMVRGAVRAIAIESATQALYQTAMGLAKMALAAMGHPTAGWSAKEHFAAAATFGLIAGGATAVGAVIGGPSGGGATASAAPSSGGSSSLTQQAAPETLSGYAQGVGSPAAPTIVINNVVDADSYIGALGTPKGKQAIQNVIQLDYYGNGPTRQVIRGGG